MKEKDSIILLESNGKNNNGNSASSANHNTAQDTIYLCNFRVSVDGDWLCLRQLDDVEVPATRPIFETLSPDFPPIYGYYHG